MFKLDIRDLKSNTLMIKSSVGQTGEAVARFPMDYIKHTCISLMYNN